MADNVTVDNGVLTDYAVSADEGAGGQVQRMKLAYSADGSEVHVSADADGLLVNLGANNDVTVAGSATSAKQDTIITAVQAIQTAVELLDNAIAGNELQVDIVSGAGVVTATVLPVGSANIAVGTASVTTTSAEAVATRATRTSITLKALATNTANLTIGPSGVASGAGFALEPGASITLSTKAAIHADAASGTQTLEYIEEYN